MNILKRQMSQIRFVMIEHYKDQAAVEAHNASEHFKTFFGQVSELLSAKPDIVVAQPIQ